MTAKLIEFPEDITADVPDYTLREVLTFLEQHKDNPPSLEDLLQVSDVIKGWAQAYYAGKGLVDWPPSEEEVELSQRIKSVASKMLRKQLRQDGFSKAEIAQMAPAWPWEAKQ